MAQQPSSNDELLALKKRARRRLVGAVALVLISVIVLWNVLDGEPKAAKQNVNAQAVEIISDAPQIKAASKPTVTAAPPLAEPSSGAAEAVVAPGKPAIPEPLAAVPTAPAPVKKQAEPKPEPVSEAKHEKPLHEEKKPAEKHDKPKPEPKQDVPKHEPKPAVKHEAKPAETKVVESKAEADSSGDDAKSHLIQVAALSDADKAKALVARLAEHGVKAYTEQKGEVTRVRVGPFSSREQADKALAKVQSAGASGMIISR